MSKSKFALAAQRLSAFTRHQILGGQPTIAYVGGWLGKANLGDELLWLAYCRLFPRTSLWHYDGGRVAKQLYHWSPRRLGGLLAGGTLIGQHRMWLEFTQRFRQHADPFAVFGSGVANPDLWPDGAPLSAWRPTLKESDFLGVRGPVSVSFLEQAGITGAEVVGDPALVFARNEETEIHRPKSLALNIGVADGRMWGNEEKVRDETTALARLAREAGWRVDWLVVWPKDLAITREAAATSNTDEHVHEVYTDHEVFMDLAAEASVMVGMKLHATILATCAGTPSLMLEYRSKCRDYMESIDHGQYVTRTDELNAAAMWEQVQHMDDNRTELAARVRREVNALKAKQLAAASQLETRWLETQG